MFIHERKKEVFFFIQTYKSFTLTSCFEFDSFANETHIHLFFSTPTTMMTATILMMIFHGDDDDDDNKQMKYFVARRKFKEALKPYESLIDFFLFHSILFCFFSWQ